MISNIYADSLSFSGAPAPLVINQATAGGNPISVSNSSTSYNIVNLKNGAKLVGSINANMPPHTTLTIAITAPSQATRPGPIALSTTAQTLTMNIPPCSYNALPITYTFSATIAAGVISTTQRIVTITLIN